MSAGTGWFEVCAEADLPPGSRRAVEANGIPVAVFNVDGAYYAIEDLCSHEQEILSAGELSGCEVACPRHGARFSVITGAALSEPAEDPVATFAVRIVDGVVQVRGERIYIDD